MERDYAYVLELLIDHGASVLIADYLMIARQKRANRPPGLMTDPRGGTLRRWPRYIYFRGEGLSQHKDYYYAKRETFPIRSGRAKSPW